MPIPRDEEEEEVTGQPAGTPVEAAPPDSSAPRPPRILAPSRWNSNLWGGEPASDGNIYDRPDYTDGPYGPGGGPPAAPGASGGSGDETPPWSKKPRHMTIYGGRGYDAEGNLRPLEQGGSSSGGSAAAGGRSTGTGGTGPGSGGGTGPASAYDDLTAAIQDSLNAILNGKDIPFGDAEISRMKDAAFAATQGQARAGQDQINRDLIRRGVFRSGIAAQAGADLQRAALQQYGQGVNQAHLTAAQENYNARMAGIDRAQKHLDSYRQYILQKDMNEIDRQKALDTIKLGYARLTVEERIADKQIAAAKKGGGGGVDPFNAFLAQYFSGASSAPAPPF